MNVTCPNCSKSLKVKDEWAGRALKCPACAKTFKATANAAPVAGRPAPAAAKAKADRARGGGLAMNWGAISIWSGIAIVLLMVAAVVVVPYRVSRYWNAHESQADGDVRDVVDFALKVQASRAGHWNANKSGSPPSVADLRFMVPYVAVRLPDRVKFDGTTSNGSFEGTYDVESGEIDMTLDIEGYTLPGGVHISAEGITIPGGPRNAAPPAGVPKFPQAAAKQSIHVAGRVRAGQPQAELDGKKGEIYYPPAVDEDGNPIAPAGPAAEKSP